LTQKAPVTTGANSTALTLDQYLQTEYAKAGGKANYEAMVRLQGIQTKASTDAFVKNPNFFSVVEKQSEGQAAAMEQQLSQLGTPGKAPAEVKTPTTATKQDRPSMDLFIMSYCPFGTQAQKGFLPVIEKFSKYADVKIKFVHYTMHGKTETEENVRQYCIQKDQPSAYINYTKCFLEAGKSEDCLKTAKVDTKKLTTCYDSTWKTFKIDEALASKSQYPAFTVNADESKKFGVQGSPTVVINGVISEAVGRSAASYQAALCNAFTDSKKPSICNQALPDTTFDPGFGFTSNGTAQPASCGN
jgi:protein-disulfide isomerase